MLRLKLSDLNADYFDWHLLCRPRSTFQEILTGLSRTLSVALSLIASIYADYRDLSEPGEASSYKELGTAHQEATEVSTDLKIVE